MFCAQREDWHFVISDIGSRWRINICFMTFFDTFGITAYVHFLHNVMCTVAVIVEVNHTLFLPPTHIDSVPPPGVTVTDVTSSQVVYETTAHGNATRVIVRYEVFRFGVPMIGEYANTGGGRRVTISPAVPGAQYRITAWALGNGSRSATPAVKSVSTGEASEFYA